jgi:hypothetical protein
LFLGSPKNPSFVATNEGVLRAMKKLGGALGELLETCFCVFPQKIDLGETSGKLLEMLSQDSVHSPTNNVVPTPK